MDTQAYLTPDEVAARFKVPRVRVIGWARSGRLPGTKVGRVWRFTEEDLETFVRGESTPEDLRGTGVIHGHGPCT